MIENETKIAISDFQKCQIHVGTIVKAELNSKARDPAYVLSIDFGPDIGVRQSSAQITNCHALDTLPGTQILAVTNFLPKRVAGIRSEVLVLAAVNAAGHAVLVSPQTRVENGSRVS